MHIQITKQKEFKFPNRKCRILVEQQAEPQPDRPSLRLPRLSCVGSSWWEVKQVFRDIGSKIHHESEDIFIMDVKPHIAMIMDDDGDGDGDGGNDSAIRHQLRSEVVMRMSQLNREALNGQHVYGYDWKEEDDEIEGGDGGTTDTDHHTPHRRIQWTIHLQSDSRSPTESPTASPSLSPTWNPTQMSTLTPTGLPTTLLPTQINHHNNNIPSSSVSVNWFAIGVASAGGVLILLLLFLGLRWIFGELIARHDRIKNEREKQITEQHV